jgi:hypothetical protein
MPEKYGTHETATLIVLTLFKEVPNPDLKKDYGIELSPAGRAALNKAGLIKSQTDNRPFVHRITDAGMAWCETELAGVEPPPRTGPLVRMVFTVIRQLVQYLRQNGIRLVDVIRPADLESLIREAYQELSVKPQDWVRLAKLRPKLNGAGKDEVDEVLLAMVRTGLVHLAPSSNRKALTDEDNDAAITIGGQDKHLMAIEES